MRLRMQAGFFPIHSIASLPSSRSPPPPHLCHSMFEIRFRSVADPASCGLRSDALRSLPPPPTPAAMRLFFASCFSPRRLSFEAERGEVRYLPLLAWFGIRTLDIGIAVHAGRAVRHSAVWFGCYSVSKCVDVDCECGWMRQASL